MLHVGVDLAETQPHQICFMDEWKLLAEFRVPNDAAGLSELLRQIVRHEPDRTQVVIAAERPDGPFVGGLLDAGYTVYAINPKAMERYRERYSVGGPKSDRVDARCLAGLLRTDREAYRPIQPDSPLTRELRLQLRAALYASFPAALRIFSDLTAPSALGALRTFPTLQAIRQATDAELASTLKQHGYSSPTRKVRRLREVLAGEQFQVDGAVVAAKSVLIHTLAETLLTLHAQIRGFERQIKDRFKKHPDREVFLSLRGAGLRLAARIAAELGDDRWRFASAADIAAFAGTAPVTRQSGKSRVAHFRRACCKSFREVMHLFAFCSLNWNQWAWAYYDAKRRQGKKHAEALRCLACIWLRIIYAMWRDGTTYDPARFLSARRAQQPAPAQ